MGKLALKKRNVILVAVGIAIALIYGVAFFFHGYFVYWGELGNSNVFSEVSVAINSFQQEHGRWPTSSKEIAGSEYVREGSLPDDTRDYLTGDSLRFVEGQNWWYMDETGSSFRILAMSPGSYRTELWPFGEMKTTVIFEFSGRAVHCGVHPSTLQRRAQDGREADP